jgi:hypothetical protein
MYAPDHPVFEMRDGVPQHPLLAHRGLSPSEKLEAERIASIMICLRGGGGDLAYLGVIRNSERER